MAENLMPRQKGPRTRTGQAGFSMIEMLMTAFVLGVGLLGLCMLQTFSLRGARGSRSLVTAVHVGEGILDEVEMEGRLSWLNITNNHLAAPVSLNAQFKYIPLAIGGQYQLPAASAPGETFNILGQPISAVPAPALTAPIFTAITQHVDDKGNAAVGQVSDYQVTVTFYDGTNASQAPVQRRVVLTRRIVHG